MTESVVVAQCVACKATREIRAGEIPAGQMPMCQKCYSPMVAKEARRR